MELQSSDTLVRLKETFQGQITCESPNPSTIFINADPSCLKTIAEYITVHLQGRFVMCAAIDKREAHNLFTVLYLFSLVLFLLVIK